MTLAMDIPPFPTFIVLTFLSILTTIKLILQRTQPLIPLFPAHVIGNLLVSLLAIISVWPSGVHILVRLFGNHLSNYNYDGRDVYGLLMQVHPRFIWYMTGETPESFDAIVRRIGAQVTLPRHTPRVPATNRRRACKLDVSNRVLLVIIWLRQYLKLDALAFIFAINKSTAAEEIYHIVPILFTCYRSFITWHSLQEWGNFLNTMPHFPNAVGVIDATTHRIQRPTGPRQADFYRGDKKYHFMSTQLIVDADGLIVLLVAG